MSRALKLTLLAMVFPHGSHAAAPDPATLGEAEWLEIDRMAREHRLRPLLHASGAAGRWNTPAPICAAWQAAYRRAALIALRQRADLIRIARLLDGAGIAGSALKGGSFVWEAWFDPALRPMRDLDILLGEADANRAYHLLREAGYRGPENPELDGEKHLPALFGGAPGQAVELHLYLFATYAPAQALREAAFRAAATAQPRVLAGIGPGAITGFSATATLIHIIIHAVLDHKLNNGPLLLLDLEELIAHGEIDWAEFWQMAASIGAVRSCQLALALAQHWHRGEAALCIDWLGHTPDRLSVDLLDKAGAMMLIAMEQRSELGWPAMLLAARRGERRAWLRAFLGRGWAKSREPAPADRDASGSQQPAVGAVQSLLTAAQTSLQYLRTMIAAPGRRHIGDSVAVANWLQGE